MGTYTILAQPHHHNGWPPWLSLLIATGTIALAAWYAAPWVAAPYSWLMDTVIPVWIDQHSICSLEAITLLKPT